MVSQRHYEAGSAEQFDLVLKWPAAAEPTFTLRDEADALIQNGTVISSGNTSLNYYAIADMPTPAAFQNVVAQWVGTFELDSVTYPFTKRVTIRVTNTVTPDAE